MSNRGGETLDQFLTVFRESPESFSNDPQLGEDLVLDSRFLLVDLVGRWIQSFLQVKQTTGEVHDLFCGTRVWVLHHETSERLE